MESSPDDRTRSPQISTGIVRKIKIGIILLDLIRNIYFKPSKSNELVWHNSSDGFALYHLFLLPVTFSIRPKRGPDPGF